MEPGRPHGHNILQRVQENKPQMNPILMHLNQIKLLEKSMLLTRIGRNQCTSMCMGKLQWTCLPALSLSLYLAICLSIFISIYLSIYRSTCLATRAGKTGTVSWHHTLYIRSYCSGLNKKRVWGYIILQLEYGTPPKPYSTY